MAMTSRVGVFSAVIAVSIGALAFKGVDIAQAFANEAEPSPAAPEAAPSLVAEEGAAPEAAPEEAPPAAAAAAAAPTPEQCLTTLNSAAEEMGLSSQEIVVLRSLQARRETLDQREAALQTREAAASAAEGRLNEQIGQLKSVETQVQGLLAQMDSKGSERMTALVKTYESMKPKDAATIFNTMDDKILVDLAKTMKPATLAAIMSSMTPQRAQILTRLLADLAKPPANLNMPPSATTAAPT